MDLWVLEGKYETLISEVYAKKKKGDGVWKKMLINNIIRSFNEEVKHKSFVTEKSQ